jgi:hypothetical protein
MEKLQPMFNLFREHVAQHIVLSNEEFAHSTFFFVTRKVRKEQYLMCTVGHSKDGVMIEESLFWDNQTFMKQIGLVK